MKIIGGQLSTTFSNFDLLWSKIDFFGFLGLFSKSFSLETIDFCEKSFCTAVSRYNMSHITRMTHTFEKKGATLVSAVSPTSAVGVKSVDDGEIFFGERLGTSDPGTVLV